VYKKQKLREVGARNLLLPDRLLGLYIFIKNYVIHILFLPISRGVMSYTNNSHILITHKLEEHFSCLWQFASLLNYTLIKNNLQGSLTGCYH
jgi:hypothetical protein